MHSNEIRSPSLIDFLSNGLKIDRKQRWSAKKLLLHQFMVGTDQAYHGNMEELLKAKRVYSVKDIKCLMKRLIKLLPEISKYK